MFIQQFVRYTGSCGHSFIISPWCLSSSSDGYSCFYASLSVWGLFVEMTLPLLQTIHYSSYAMRLEVTLCRYTRAPIRDTVTAPWFHYDTTIATGIAVPELYCVCFVLVLRLYNGVPIIFHSDKRRFECTVLKFSFEHALKFIRFPRS